MAHARAGSMGDLVHVYSHEKTGLERFLDVVERVGNKVPHPVVIFVLLIGLVILLSHVFYLMGASVTYQTVNTETHAVEEATTAVRSLLTVDGIRMMYADVVQNFMNFTAVGVIIVAMLGVGVAEAAGLIKAMIRKLVMVAPAAAADLHPGVRRDPLEHRGGCRISRPDSAGGGGLLSVGRHPLAGLAASFAGVAAVFSVNIFVKPLDGMLVGITNDAIGLMNPGRTISLTSNLWFSIASVILLTAVVGSSATK